MLQISSHAAVINSISRQCFKPHPPPPLFYFSCTVEHILDMRCLSSFHRNYWLKSCILGFHPCDETAMLVFKTIENGSTNFCIIAGSNSQKTFYSLVLYTNMAAMTSDENPQLKLYFSSSSRTQGWRTVE